MTTIHERMRDAAVARASEESALRRAIERQALGPRVARHRLGHIVTVQPDPAFSTAYQDGTDPSELVTVGSYAVEMIERIDRNTEKSMWTTLHDGGSDPWVWFTVDQALIHLIAVRKGQRDNQGEIVTFASRVIGFNDSPS